MTFLFSSLQAKEKLDTVYCINMMNWSYKTRQGKDRTCRCSYRSLERCVTQVITQRFYLRDGAQFLRERDMQWSSPSIFYSRDQKHLLAANIIASISVCSIYVRLFIASHFIHFFFFLLFFLDGDLERDLDRFFRDELFLVGVPLRDLDRLRLCFPLGERLRDRDLPRPRDELRLRDRDRLEFEGEGVRDS